MKKIIIALSILASLVLLVACSQTASTTDKVSNSAALSTEAQLLVGTFKLEDTDLAVTADQAKQLLPLWQTLQSLSSSSTSATEEVNAVVDQIKSTMTAQQTASITAMKLSQSDMMSIMGQVGFSPNGTNATTTPMALNGQGAGGPGGGGMPAGGPPAGGGPQGGSGDFPGGGDPGMGPGMTGQSSTPQAVRPDMSNQVPQPLVNALIELLKKKIQ